MTDLTDLGVARDPRRRARRATSPRAKWPRRSTPRSPRPRRSTPSSSRRPTTRSPPRDAADAARAAGEPLGQLAGVPIGMKDLFATKGVQTTAASHILEGFVPRVRKHRVARSCGTRARGCSASSTWTSSRWARRTRPAYFGNVISPWRRNDGGNAPLAPGGSSGGSSAAVAARLCPARPAPTPAARSASPPRSPASRGIKPTYGRCSRWGIVAFASSLDQAGPMARDVRDCAIMLEAMAGFDPKDATTLDLPVPDWEAGLIARSARQDGRHPARISHRRHRRRDRRAVGAGHRLAEGCRRRDRRGHRCRTPNMRCRPITSSRRPRPRRTSRAMTACATACATCPRARTCRTCTPPPAPPASATRSSAAS